MTSIISIEKVEKVLKSEQSKILCEAIVALSIFVGFGFFVYTVCSFYAWKVRDVPAALLADYARNFHYRILIFALLAMFVCYVLDDKVTLKKFLISSLGMTSFILIQCECIIPYMAHRIEEEQKKNPPIRMEACISPILEPGFFKGGWHRTRTRDCVEIYVSVCSLAEYDVMRRMMNGVLYQEIKNKCIIEGDSIKLMF